MALLSPYALAVRRPRLTLTVWGVAVVFGALGFASLRMRTDGFALIPQGSKKVSNDAAVRKTFGLQDRIMVVLESTKQEGIFCQEALGLVSALTAQIKQLPGTVPNDIASLATEPSGRFRMGPVQFPSLLDPLPRTDGEVEQARSDAVSLGLYSGKLLSRERATEGRVWSHRATTILVGIAPDNEQRRNLPDAIKRLGERLLPDGYSLHVVGTPVAESLLGDYIISDLARLIPATILIMAVAFYWLFGSLWLVLVVFAEIAACLLATFGLMGYAGVPVTIAMSVLPLVVIPVIVADEIHIFAEICRREGPWPQVVAESFDACWVSVVKTGVTTMISGLVFAIGPVQAIRDFGLFLSLASLICTLWTITGSPALLLAYHRPSGTRMRQPGSQAAMSASVWITKHPKAAVAALLPLAALAAVGLEQINVQDSWTGGFSANSEFRRSVEKVDTLFDGTQFLHVVFDARPTEVTDSVAGSNFDARLLDPDVMGLLAKFEEYLETAIGPEHGGILGAHQQLAVAGFIRFGGNQADRHTGSSVQANHDLMELLKAIRGPKRFQETFDAHKQQALITVFLRGANYAQIRHLLDQLEIYEARHLTPAKIRLGYAGDVILSQAIVEAVTYSELWSILGSLAAMCIVIWLMERSFKTGVLCTLPSAVAITANLSIMGLLGIPLGVASSMFAGISFGIGVDAAIHFTGALRRTGEHGAAAVARVLPHFAAAVAAEALVLTCGFAMLCASSAPSNQCLGIILISTFASCSAVTVCLLPAVYSMPGTKTADDRRGF